MLIIEMLLIIIGAYLSIYTAYILMLLFAHFLIKDKNNLSFMPKSRFAVIIPAHNEELLLLRLLQSINKQHYPSHFFKVVVIADNCTDSTAKIGRENVADVLERFDNINHGKGYAIKYALENINIKEYDAIFIIDADSVVDKDLLKELDILIQEGKIAIQCYNGVFNHNDSWFTRMLDVSRTISNEIFHPAKVKLGFSSYLMGNGMCFSTKILKKYGWDAFTIGEDWEYYARLISNGEVVSFGNKARVYHQESASLKQATSQRMRWSSGRFEIALKYGMRLFYKGLLERDLRKIESSFPLILPNPSLGINMTVLFFVLSFLAPSTARLTFNIWSLNLIVVQIGIFIVGVAYTENKFKKFLSIFIAPIFLAWKMGIDMLSVFGIGRGKWIRTERKL